MSLTVRIRGDASQFEKTMRGVKGTIGGLSSKIAGIGAAAAGAAAGYITLSKAIEFVKSSSEKAASIEDLAMQFEVLTGSATKSAELLKAFREEEKKSALNTQDYAEAAKTFLAFGGSLEDTLPSLRMLADVSMGNSERFGSLALAFAQTTAAGRLMGQEVLQFVNAGFNPLEQISRDTGESMAVLKKRMEDGGISVQMVKQAFKNATSEGGRFFGAIDKGSATTNAKINQTEAAVTQLQVAFGTGFNEGLKDALDAANNFLPQLTKTFESAGLLVGDAISKAVQGDTERLANIGAFIGTAIFEGMKAVYLRGFDELIAGGQNKFAEDDITKFGRLVAEKTGNKNFRGRAAPEKVQPANLAGYMQTAIENVSSSSAAQGLQKANLEIAIREGMKTGIDMSMPQAVREGVLEAMKRQPQEAKFSN